MTFVDEALMNTIGNAGAEYMVPPLFATSDLLPLSNEATAFQFASGVLPALQVSPEFVEEKTGPPSTAASNFRPSDEHAAEKAYSEATGATFHVVPELVEIHREFWAAATMVVSLLDYARLCQLVFGATVVAQCAPPSVDKEIPPP